MTTKQKKSALIFLCILSLSVLINYTELLILNVNFTASLIAVVIGWILYLINFKKTILYLFIIIALSTIGLLRFDYFLTFSWSWYITSHGVKFGLGLQFVNLILLYVFYKQNLEYLVSFFRPRELTDGKRIEIERQNKEREKQIIETYINKYQDKSENELKEIVLNSDSFVKEAVKAVEILIEKKKLVITAHK